jgi:hypothetical protein
MITGRENSKRVRENKLFILSTSLLLLFLIPPVIITAQTGTSDTTNLALTATVSTSHVSPWETLSAVNDGITPASSADNSDGAYGNWRGEEAYGEYDWVEYEWSLVKDLTSTSVYWWDNGGGIQHPNDAYIVYWGGTEWVNAGNIGTLNDQYNSLKLGIRSSRIRIYMKSVTSTGILEWRVYGVEGGPCSATPLTSSLRINEDAVQDGNNATIAAGDSVTFIPGPDESGDWYWDGPDGFTSSGRTLTISDATATEAGTYTVTFINECGATSSIYFTLTVFEGDDPSAPFTWTYYNPGISYDFRDEFPELEEPQNILDDCEGVVGEQASGWWVFRWGANANPLVTEAAITPMLERMNTDFAYFRDIMGWPPDKRAKNGYKSAIYLYGSGLCTDDQPNTALGGWQGSIYYQGQSWPMVLLSYYPVYSFDPSCPYNDRYGQMGAVVHEGIHSVLADLPGCRKAAWFHEGGNTWLQQEADSRRSGDYSSMGFLNGASFVAPFMPIECYSGWLQDGSFGGPSAEGVNMFVDGTQICTWRNLLGGVQYSNIFPTFLGMTLGAKSIPWIWRYAEGRVLEGIAEGLGEQQTRKLIMEYRAKQALIDMGEWTGAVKKLLDQQFGTAIRAEWQPSWLNPQTWYATPYAKTTNDGNGLLTPEQRTTPGWSGANQIPLVVSGDIVTVNFQPAGPNMSLQLCYRTRDGQTVYSNPVYGGDCSLSLDLQPANSVVFAVITNTDYIYKGEETRTAHYDYRLQLVEGVSHTADINKQWYDWTKVISTAQAVKEFSDGPGLVIYPVPAERNSPITVRFETPPASPVTMRIMNVRGQMVWSEEINGDITIGAGELPVPGVYIATFQGEDGIAYKRLVVN